MKKRIIPFLMLHDEQLYKSQQFDDLTYIGDPIIAMKIFNEKQAEEVCLVDIDPSKYNQPINFALIKEIVSEAFTPICYGGGIRSILDAEKLLYIGIEKLIINTSAVQNKNLIRELVNEFGSSTVVGGVDYKTIKDVPTVFCSAGKINTGISANDHISTLIDQGVGEIFINSIDRDGMMNGLDTNFIQIISKKISTPLIASGGVGNFTDIQNGFTAGADAIAAGSLFVYKGPLKAVLINYPDPKTANEIRNFAHA